MIYKVNLQEYLEFTRTTCVNASFEALYYGFAEEIGEFCGALKRRYRGDEKYQNNKFFHQVVCKELGDILWYAVQLYDNFVDPVEKDETFIVQLSCIHTLTDLMASAIDFCTSNENSESITKTDLFAAIQSVFAIAESYNLRPSDIINRNVGKLSDRKQRGVIKGDGDER